MKMRYVKTVNRELYDAFSRINREAKREEKDYHCEYTVEVKPKCAVLASFVAPVSVSETTVVTTGNFVAKQKAFAALKVISDIAVANAICDVGGTPEQLQKVDDYFTVSASVEFTPV